MIHLIDKIYGLIIQLIDDINKKMIEYKKISSYSNNQSYRDNCVWNI